MEFAETSLKGAYLIKPKVFRDERGFFLEFWNEKVFAENRITAKFVQDNHSLSTEKGTLRGLHFQLPPLEQAKLVRVTKGSIYDVIVDLRKDSQTFKKWESFELSAPASPDKQTRLASRGGDNFEMLFVPRGFAHGFVTLEENTEVIYKVDNLYSSEHDSGIIWNDPDLKIDWPIKNPILSNKDSQLQLFKDFNSPF